MANGELPPMSRRHQSATAAPDEVQALRDRVAELERADRERRRIEESLSESRARQKAILDNISDIAWLKDRDSRYVAVNEAFTRFFGFSTDRLIGATDHDLWPAESADKYRRKDLEVLRSGIEADKIPRLFDPFFTTRHAEGGTGLGLSIVHGIITDHGGTIDVSSDATTGTTFTVFLPRQFSSGGEGSGS